MAMNNVNATKMMNSNVFGNQATATVNGRGNVIVGGTRSVIAGDNYIISTTETVADNIRALTFNGVPTGIVPRIYVANLTQAGVADPVADIMNNSFGNIVWTRASLGNYTGTIIDYALGVILSAELTVIINNIAYDGVVAANYSATNNTIDVYTSQIGVGFADGYLNNTTIEVKYYI
jgi:hypothetical protein